jgi:hypothetical protein
MSEALILNSSPAGNFRRIILLLPTNLFIAPFIPPYLSSVGVQLICWVVVRPSIKVEIGMCRFTEHKEGVVSFSFCQFTTETKIVAHHYANQEQAFTLHLIIHLTTR